MKGSYFLTVIISYIANFAMVLIFSFLFYSSYSKTDDSIFRTAILTGIYLLQTHCVLAILMISYFFYRMKYDRFRKFIIIVLPHLIFLIIVVLQFNELLISHLIINTTIALYSYNKLVG